MQRGAARRPSACCSLCMPAGSSAESMQKEPSQAAKWCRGPRLFSCAPGRPFEAHASAQIFFLAGMETTAHAATWVLFQLSQHPGAEAAMEAELDAAGLLVTAARPHPRALEHSDLAGLVYLQAVIKARMLCRLHPLQCCA